MTAEQRDQIILKAWQERLRRKDGIPANLADTYATWLRGIIKQAVATLQPEAKQQGQDGGAGGGQPPAEEGAA